MMNYDRVIVVMKHDLSLYPPVISVCNILRELGVDVVYIGANSNSKIKESMDAIGVKMYIQPQYGGNLVSRLLQQIRFKIKVAPIIKKNYGFKTIIWFVHYETVILFKDFFYKCNCIAHLLEFRMPQINIRYRFIAGFRIKKDTLKHAKKVICCEYNRAHLTKAFFNLSELPIILPNKPYIVETLNSDDEKKMIDDIKRRLQDKKVIIYQGGFMKERKLDQFCEAMNYLPKEYVFVAMGGESEEKKRLKNKYESDRCVFLPHIRPPYHLEITRLAHIGILSYIPLSKDLGQMINVLYCAPNKIFEYGRYGIPMISNDLPSLKLQFSEIKCGELVDESSSTDIAKMIKKIDADYSTYSENALILYNSVDVKKIIEEIVK